MEQKKTLWIIAAAGAFLLVVLAAAGIMYSPVKNQSQAIKTVALYNNNEKNPVSNNGWINPQENDDFYNNILPPSAEKKDLYVFADSATVYELADKNQKSADNSGSSNNSETIDLNLLKNEIASEQTKSQNINTTVNIPSEKSEKKDDFSVSAEKNQNIAVQKKSGNVDYYVSKSDSKSNTKTAAEKTTVTSTSVKTQNVAVKNEIKQPEFTQYWVQVASYSNKKGSENARGILDSNKIPADIFTYVDNKDKMFFRVRVGPYTTKSEAEYWRTKINKIDEFAKSESYVTSTKS